MGRAIALREDFDGAALRRLAKGSRDAGQSRRLLALAEIYDGGRRTDAARIGDVGLQVIRDWVLHFNAEGPNGLIDGKAPGKSCKLDDAQRQALARIVEVVRLKAGDLDSAQSIIRIVQAKGRKDRKVMLPADILGLLRLWWKERPRHQDRDVAPPERWLFPGRNPGRPLTTRQFARLFQETVKKAGITKPVSLHSLRHSFATHLLERGVDIRVIQALLGHDKLETTARYTRVATGMISAVDSPLDDLGKGRRKRRKTGGQASG